VTSANRSPALPEVPPVADTLPGFEASSWYGISAPGGTPKDVLFKLNQEIARRISTPDVRERVAGEGAEIVAGSPDQFGAFYRAEIEKWGKIIRAAGIRLE